MKNTISALVILVLSAVFLTACVGNGRIEITPTPELYIVDSEGLIAALNAADAVRGVEDSVKREFFSVDGQTVTVREAEILVFEYETNEAMEVDASLVSADGGSIGTTMISWVSTPHFFKAGRIIVVYIGEDSETLAQLQSLLGAQFSGR